VQATLHLLPEGSPFCCSEPNCHLGLHDDGELASEVAERVRHALHLRQELSLDFSRTTSNVHPGVRLLVLENLFR
jgi:hypothetical protein